MTDVLVRIPPPLRASTGGLGEVRVPGATVGDAVVALTERFPALRRHLLSADGAFRRSVAVYVNDADIRAGDGERTGLRPGDVVSFVAAVAGGSGDPELVRRPPAPAAPGRSLSTAEVRRYSRHLLLPEIGAEGQRRLSESKVLVVGTGGLGAPAALYLAAAGVGEIGLVDHDAVELSNLQRQVLFSTRDVGRAKLDAAAERLRALNPEIRIVPHPGRLDSRTALDVLRPYDVVLDGTDNFATRYLVNDACVLLGKPDVYGSIYRFEGQVSVFDARAGPCYRCLYPEPPPPDLVPSCGEAGVLGALPGVVGTLQATEAVKLLLSIGEPLRGRLLLYDAAAMRFRELALAKNPDCVVCSPNATLRELIDYDAFCGTSAATGSVPEIGPTELKSELAGPRPPVLVDVREPGERAISRLPGALEIPLRELTEHVGELSSAESVVVFCRSGGRSSEAVRTLLDLGFQRVRNLRGGINAWAEAVDPSMPVY